MDFQAIRFIVSSAISIFLFKAISTYNSDYIIDPPKDRIQTATYTQLGVFSSFRLELHSLYNSCTVYTI